MRRIQEALGLTQALAHPHSLVLARCWAAWLHQFCQRHEQILQEPTETAITIASEQGLSFYSGILASVHGRALARQGSTEEGPAQRDQGIALCKANLSEHIVPYLLALRAETQSNMSRSQEAAQSLNDALALAEKNGEHFFDAELYRLKGELLLAQELKSQKPVLSAVEGAKGKRQTSKIETDPQPLNLDPRGEAEACFHKAIDIARQQQAKSLELHATVSLARLWRQQGKQHEAHRMLSEICGWFTEGFGTKDLQEAKALLEELA